MPVRRGHIAPQNVFIDNLIQRLEAQGRVFCMANARLDGRPIIYCSLELLSLTGHRRGEVMQLPARCDFLRGPGTPPQAAEALAAALEQRPPPRSPLPPRQEADDKNGGAAAAADEEAQEENQGIREQRVHTLLYKKDGSEFECDCVVTPIQNQHGEVEFYTVSFHLHQDEVCYNKRESILPPVGERPLLRALRGLISLASRPESASAARRAEAGDGGATSGRRHGSDADSPEAIVIATATAPLTTPLTVTKAVAHVLSLGSDVLPGYNLQQTRARSKTIMLHYSLFKAVWDWLVLLLVLYTAVYTPYYATFLLSDDRHRQRLGKLQSSLNYKEPMSLVDAIVDVMFIIDIFINFRTTYVNKKDEVVCDGKKIAVHYLKGWFVIDLVAALPFDLILLSFDTGSDEMTTLIGLFKTARLLRLVRVARKLDRYSEYGAAVLALLMASFALIAHWLSCVWYAIGVWERPDTKVGWLEVLADQLGQPYIQGNASSGPSLQSKYITALYFTFSSLTSVGFGNVSPNTNLEKSFGICVMVAGSLMYASIFGNVAAIIQRLYSGSARYHAQLMRVREFVRFHQIPEPLGARLEEYFEHAWARTNGIDMELVLRGFPDCLQADICLHLNHRLLATCPAFRTAGPGCLRALATRIRTTNVPPGDIILHKGDLLSAVYFVASGSLEVLRDDSVLGILGPGDAFGEAPGPGCPVCGAAGRSGCAVRALAHCELHRLAGADLREVLDAYPEFAEGFAAGLDVSFRLRDPPCDHRGGLGGGSRGARVVPPASPVSIPSDASTVARLSAMETMLDRLESRLGRMLAELDGRDFIA